MAKIKNEQAGSNAVKVTQTAATKSTLSELKGNRNVWYKSRVGHTVNELYISEPYFTASEAALIKGTVLKNTIDAEVTLNEQVNPATKDPKTVEEAIKERLSNFYEKRKASGDFRPCGPHDMAPVYLSVFGIARGELEDERFLGRLRRSGLG